MEDVHHVVSHALLGHNDLLAAVYDKVTTLVIAAILTVLHSLVFVQVFELAEVTAEHDWDLADVNSSIVLLKDHLFDPTLALSCFRAVIEVVL